MTKEITIEIDDAREVMYGELEDLVGEERLVRSIEEQVRNAVTHLYDNKDDIAAQMQQ